MIALIFIIAIGTAIKFDKFSFGISNGAASMEIHGEQQKARLNPSGSISPALAVSNQAVENSKTEGSQSPIVNNSHSTTTIVYDGK